MTWIPAGLEKKGQKMEIIIVILLLVIGVIAFEYLEEMWYEHSYYQMINAILKAKEKHKKEYIKAIDDKFLLLLNSIECEKKYSTPRTRFDIGYILGEFDMEIDEAFQKDMISASQYRQLHECGRTAAFDLVKEGEPNGTN